MKITWLENCQIRPEIRESIYKDIEKIANIDPGTSAHLLAQQQKGGEIGSMVLTMLGLPAMQALWNMLAGKVDASKGRGLITASKKSVVDTFTKDEQLKASARFDEVAQIAPHVAMNTALSSRIVKENLNSGISADLARKLATLQAQYMPNALRASNYLPKTASVRPEILGDIVADIYLIKEAANPKVLRALKLPEPVTKAGKTVIDWGPQITAHAKTLLGLSIIGGASGLVGGGINWVASKLKQRGLSKALEAAYNEAITGDTTHSQILRDKPEAAKNAFKTLSHFAPHVALEPTAARGFMAKIVEYGQGGMDIGDMKALSDIQKNMTLGQAGHPFIEGFKGTPTMLKSLAESSGPASKILTDNYESYTTSDLPLTP